MLALKQPLPRGLHVAVSDSAEELVRKISDPKNARVYDLPTIQSLSYNEISGLIDYLLHLDSEGEFLSVWDVLVEGGKV